MEKDPAVRDRRPEEAVVAATPVKADAVMARVKDRDPAGAGGQGPEDRTPEERAPEDRKPEARDPEDRKPEGQ